MTTYDNVRSVDDVVRLALQRGALINALSEEVAQLAGRVQRGEVAPVDTARQLQQIAARLAAAE
ncbi:hypothetical protein F5972_08665 [Microbispora cellulosiformans]|uniref:Uncharacterized protein n=1 Tax=Microbispora cellulosiformans TaxID=2614688 RepID=A0A5J5K8H3_9ACTN|nr:hypothetical protein [Microbispora cellulosiformans]KAA9379713.1 hypothetical protein F5972_08665 [Microbispora cellulosiformans]